MVKVNEDAYVRIILCSYKNGFVIDVMMSFRSFSGGFMASYLNLEYGLFSCKLTSVTFKSLPKDCW